MSHANDWYDRVPKVELHLHLEGAIPLAPLWELIQKYGGDPAVPNFPALEQKFRYRDFSHFIRTWVWKNGFLREYEDFTLIAAAVAKDLRAQNIRYVEAFFSPPDFARHNLKAQEITEAVRKGLSQVPEIEVALIADLVRDYGSERAARSLRDIAEVKDLGVIGIGIGGTEGDFPPALFSDVYEDARKFGFHTSAHAGEAAGAVSVWGAIRELGVNRIGHGTRIGEDPALLDYVVQNRIPLEMCPLSNVRTAVVESLSKHPIRNFFERGALVTVNTDDPKMFGNSLSEEFRGLHEALAFSDDELRQLILNGIESSWLSSEKKTELRTSFEADPDWLT
ncbi:MAG: adenosine deaminase [Bdellovibrionales bacterium GWB1_55_8]|nr:MAG: adenosine deaminase [Bdellovibrionales bacterium GWB1_55_8]